jgi:hypothetical protein
MRGRIVGAITPIGGPALPFRNHAGNYVDAVKQAVTSLCLYYNSSKMRDETTTKPMRPLSPEHRQEERNPVYRPKIRQCRSTGAVSVSDVCETALGHFQEKWNPVFRPKMRQRKNARAVSVSGLRETALERLFRAKVTSNLASVRSPLRRGARERVNGRSAQ